MYAETGLMFPYYYQSFSPDIQQFDDFYSSQKSFACLGSVVQSSSISDYDLGGEGDLFKAPVPIIEQPLVTLNPMTAAMSMISCGEDNISPQELSVTVIESLQNEEFLTDVFHEYKDIMAKEAATETSPLSEVVNYKFSFKTDDNSIDKENGQIFKSMSSDCLSSMECSHGGQVKPSFPTITEVDFGNACGMRRAFSEGDIKTLGNCNGSFRHSSGGHPQLINEHTTSNEDRWQKLSRYRNKKTKRNFGRKIKYACRKALADSQPRIRGRFAKTEESEILRK
ncbi:zinc finger protein CONSTANS-LIKE 12-like [Cynara cardunculus var. scolymus]|uniref:CCT domain-containing protein n=1 Tax=Cynara cardunculus var. scolymus TaxID=59895 RepID=A0A118K2N2_CYNCS|nr:zinc finger protein CONSTANS-LIKE 12-like [Cynara cardunculus var. scolymus]KVI04667.1 CCT domain-containing protein [Cynara cardunculus var. scolymus]